MKGSDLMVVGIVAANNWFCNRCHKRHNVLYFHGKKNKYCPYCVPESIKQQAIYINQRREKINYIPNNNFEKVMNECFEEYDDALNKLND